MAYAELAMECERLAQDFGRLALADVSGAIVTERRLTWSRRPVVRVTDYERLRARISPKPGILIHGWADGCELSDVAPQTAEEYLSAPVWYSPMNCEPIVNSVGKTLVLRSGWSSLHEWELTGRHASHALNLLERAGAWTLGRWGRLSELLWPRRGSVSGGCCWLDIVNQVSELARDATLPKPNWAVVAGLDRAWWPVDMWKNRNQWVGEPQFTAEEVNRIGEDPEVVLSARKNWLADSETSLIWLSKQFLKEQTVAPVIVPDTVTAKTAGRRGRLPANESDLLKTNMLAILREHSTLADDPKTLAAMVGVSEATARRLIDSERAKFNEMNRLE